MKNSLNVMHEHTVTHEPYDSTGTQLLSVVWMPLGFMLPQQARMALAQPPVKTDGQLAGGQRTLQEVAGRHA